MTRRTATVLTTALATAAACITAALTGHTGLAQIFGALTILTSLGISLDDHTNPTHRPLTDRLKAAIDYTGPVTAALIAINATVAAAITISAAQAHADLLTPGTHAPLFASWALIPDQVTTGQWWRLLTAGFVHAGLVHLAVNMTALATIGGTVESRLGHARYAALYAVSLLTANLAVWAFANPTVPTVGASGAIFGVLGAYAVYALATHRNTTTLRTLAIIIGANLAFSLLPHVSLTAHLAGLLAGAATATCYWATGVGRPDENPAKSATGEQATDHDPTDDEGR